MLPHSYCRPAMLLRTALILSLLLLLTAASALAAGSQRLDGVWQFHFAASDPAQPPAADSTGWHAVDVPGLLSQQHGQPISGWYRLRFDWNPNQDPKALALAIDQLRHADETWLNGQIIGGEGDFEPPWTFRATNPQASMRVYPIPAGLLQAQDNVLLIRTSTGFGPAWGALFPGGAGIVGGDLRIGPREQLAEAQRQAWLRSGVADAVFITLGVVDLLLILLLLRRSQALFPEFKWLVLTSLLMLLGSAGHDIFYLTGTEIHANFLMALAMLGVPPGIALYFYAQYRNIPARLLAGLGVIWAVASLLLLWPGIGNSTKTLAWYMYSSIAALSLLYALCCAILGVIQRRIAAWPQLLAVAVYVLSIRTQWLPDVFFGHRNVQIGSLFYRYALLYAYIARLQQMQVDYKALSRRVVKIADDIHAGMARELHDGIGQTLASAKLQTQLTGQSKKDGKLDGIRRELDHAIVALRRMLSGLHPVQLDQRGLAVAIHDEAQHLQSLHNGLTIDTAIDEQVVLDKGTEAQLFRIFQESVHNAIRHGKARHIDVSLKQASGRIIFCIRDDGNGFDSNAPDLPQAKRGMGLVSLRERAALMDAQIAIDSLPGEGAEVVITLPVVASPRK